MRISDMLTAIASWLENPNNEAILLAEYHDECLGLAAQACVEAAEILKKSAFEIDKIEPQAQSVITAESISDLAEVAAAFDASGDENLKRTASVIDELLLTIASPPKSFDQLKSAEDKKIDVIKQKYHDTKVKFDDINKISDTKKVLEKSKYMEEFPIEEVGLSTRTCPDHPGAQVSRVGENSWQCNLDGKIYNYEAGYTDEKGNKHPGGSVSNQSELQYSNSIGVFDTRDERLNNR